MADQPALFDLPEVDRPAPRSRTDRGRARQRYARTVLADVRVQSRTALHAKALRSFDKSLTVVIGDIDPDEPEDDGPYSRQNIAADWIAALGWLLDPTLGLWPLIEAGALRLLAVHTDLTDCSGDRCRLAWTVTIKLDDVAVFRDIAAAAVPDSDTDARSEIDQSLAAAWQRAADPYEPLRAIPGITWTPVQVSVEHQPARPARTV
ncbi:MAG TPA: hypothetical protein VFC19_54600 [Candidatus Limnocylindrales bacterium]|nr:hypothetical protein [Candidatus Limnocylindrales bacterium]